MADAAIGPTDEELWLARAKRATWKSRGALDPVVREVHAERKAAYGDFIGRHKLVDGRWVDAPERGDRELLERRLRQIDDRLGEYLRIGPRPR